MILFLYFFIRPAVDGYSAVIILGVWMTSMSLDLYTTFVHEPYMSRYESSFLLVFLYGRLPNPFVVLLVFVTEFACVVMFPAIITFQVSLGVSVAVAYVFCLLHACAIWSNENFCRNPNLRL